jgi:prepilin-type N-terminal cleavage/methylation domain-containing protein
MTSPCCSRTASTDESGMTLLEITVTITIMAIVFVVVLGAISVFTRSTTVHRSSAELDRATRTYVERLDAAAYDGACPVSYAEVTTPAGYTASVTAKNWTGTTPAVFAPCPAADIGSQQLTITVTETRTGQRQEVVVVKRKR